ncbi:MAG TPA: hypothetical protein VF017_22440 [Thermoanaerobaculia bacterium]|nr:hypothetical protein [Thermoanaerobaculia bacterium]
MAGVALVRCRRQDVVPGSRTDTPDSAGAGRATAADFASHFKGVKAAEAERILESLVAVGVALETREGQGGGRVWRPVR